MKKIIAFIITIVIFIIILMNIDIQQLKYHLLNINQFYFLISMILFIPSIILSAALWKFLIKNDCDISLKESTKMVLSGGSLNVVTPSKIGDFARAYFLKKQKILSLKRGISAVILEKTLEVFYLALFSLIGIFLIGELNAITLPVLIFSLFIFLIVFLFYFIDFSRFRIFNKLFKLKIAGKKIGSVFEDTYIYVSSIKKDKKYLIQIILYVLVMWTIQFVQIYFFFLSLNYIPPIKLIFAFVPAAILIGMLPITLGGMGTRDSALIILFSGYAPAPLMLGMGILMSLRYWIPALFGLIFLGKYLKK